jgi:catechol 2,3-dioxygenase-like lactoylglutathione lyase family enzyme
MYHPSHRVPDLEAAERFFRHVFGRASIPLALAQSARGGNLTEGYPRDYSAFTLIADVWFDCIDPDRYIIDGVQPYPTISEPHLNGFGWGVNGIAPLYREIRRQGIRCTDQLDVVVSDDEPPKAKFSESPLFWTLAEDTGLRYEIYPTDSIGPSDPRSDPAWTLPVPSTSDPLGIERCSHHTVLTARPERVLTLVVDILGGSIIHEGRNEELGAHSIYVWLGDGILEYAHELEEGTPAIADWSERAPLDTYHTLNWKVRDLGRAADHLERCGVRLRTRTDAVVVTEPSDSLGIPWTFRMNSVPNDPRS